MIALITLKEVNTTDVETRENPHEQKIDDEIKKKKNRQIVAKFNFPVQQPNSFPFFMMLDT